MIVRSEPTTLAPFLLQMKVSTGWMLDLGRQMSGEVVSADLNSPVSASQTLTTTAHRGHPVSEKSPLLLNQHPYFDSEFFDLPGTLRERGIC